MEDVFKNFLEEIKTEMISAINCGVNEAIQSIKVVNSIPEIELLSKKEVGKLLGVSMPTLDKLIEEGTIISHRLGGSIRFKKHELSLALTQRNFIKFQIGGINGK